VTFRWIAYEVIGRVAGFLWAVIVFSDQKWKRDAGTKEMFGQLAIGSSLDFLLFHPASWWPGFTSSFIPWVFTAAVVNQSQHPLRSFVFAVRSQQG